METRVSILERDVLELKEMKDQVQQTHDKVFELGVLLRALVEAKCPAPGACLDLAKRVSLLELKSAEHKGGWKVAAAVSAIVTAIITWLWNHITTFKHP